MLISSERKGDRRNQWRRRRREGDRDGRDRREEEEEEGYNRDFEGLVKGKTNRVPGSPKRK